MKKLINNYRKWNPSTYATILILIFPLITFLIIGFSLDNDFWFLINTGKTILNDGFIKIEPFTIHSGLSFVPQQWLTDIIYYLIYQKFNIQGFFYFTMMCNAIIVFLCYKLCYLVGNNRKRAILITAFTDIFLISFRFLVTRPQLFDAIIFLLEIFLLESYISKNNKKYLYPIPLLSIFLINAHASMWALLFAFMLPYLVEYIILRKKKKKTFNANPILIVFIISILVGLINPYGLEAIKYLFNSYGTIEINNLVNEMKPIDISTFFGLLNYIIIFVLLLSFYKNKGNNKIRYFLMSIGIIYLSLNHYKSLLELAILFPLILGYNFKSKSKDTKVKALLYEKIVYIILIVTASFLIINNVKLSDGVDIKEFADYLDENGSYDIKLFTGYNDGGYMEYRGYKCYIDPRAEVFLKANNHKEDIFQEFYNLEKGFLDIDVFLNKYDFDYLLVDDGLRALVNELNNNPNYEEVYSKVTDISENKKTYLFKNITHEKQKD